jgi:NAD(P)-dependent dehydrogenase (short-subunit alcohol dehydrogenase family)
MKPSVWQALEGAKLINGKVAVITGGAGGIGKAIAHLFSHQGGRLGLADLREAELREVAKAIVSKGGEVIPITADVTRPEDADRIFEVITEKYGRLDILVNNAGGGLPTDFFSITLDEWNKIIGLNLSSAFSFSQKAARIFRKQGGGVIVNLSSQAGRSASPTAGVHYTASKAGVLGLTRHMAKILGKDNIRVNAVCPGVTNTERLMARLEARGTVETTAQAIPLGRIGDTDEIAAACLFLASDLSGYVTGEALDVNGGALMV